MGVVTVLNYLGGDSKSGGVQAMEPLQKRLEALGADKTGQFTVECESYYSVPQIVPQRVLNVFQNSEYPASCFALIDNGTCLVADHPLDNLINRLNGIYTSKKGSKVELKGNRFEISDFIVKIGCASIGGSFKGVLIEIEYQPCAVAASCWNLMQEFSVNSLGLGSPNLIVQAQHLSTKLHEIYTPVDTIHQYMEHFNNLRRSQMVPATR